MEFKVHDPEEEKALSDTLEAALQQIEDKKYDAELLEYGIAQKSVYPNRGSAVGLVQSRLPCQKYIRHLLPG